MLAGILLTNVLKKSAASIFRAGDSFMLEMKVAGSSKIMLMIY
jgi:hypothetical protein